MEVLARLLLALVKDPSISAMPRLVKVLEATTAVAICRTTDIRPILSTSAAMSRRVKSAISVALAVNSTNAKRLASTSRLGLRGAVNKCFSICSSIFARMQRDYGRIVTEHR